MRGLKRVGGRLASFMAAVLLLAPQLVGPASAAPPAAPVAQSGLVFEDTLRSGALDPANWQLMGDCPGTNGAVEPRTDGVHLRLAAANTRETFCQGIVFRRPIRGDYDVSIDFRLLTWPSRNGTRFGMGGESVARNSSDRNGSGQEIYFSRFSSAGQGGGGSVVTTQDTQGRLRLTRTGNVYAAYRWSGSGWVQVNAFGGQPTPDGGMSLAIWSHPYAWGGQPVELVLENFRISKGLLDAAPAGPYTRTDDFGGYTAGQAPAGWQAYGTTQVAPVVQEVGGTGSAYRQLSFPFFAAGYAKAEKHLIYDAVSCRQFTATVKLKFQTGGDEAGLVFGWRDESNYVWVAPNVYWDSVHFIETVNGSRRLTTNTPDRNITIAEGSWYWLRVTAQKDAAGSNTAVVYWSTDGTNFKTLVTVNNLANIEGKLGLRTSGVHLPQALFDDFSVAGDCGPPAPPTRAIVYIGGLASSGATHVSEAPSWLTPYLLQHAGVAKIAHFSYSGRWASGTGENEQAPDYGVQDTCGSIKDTYYGILKGLVSRLNGSAGASGASITLAGHSQGGLIASYFVARLKQEGDPLLQRINGVMTFDSFPHGIGRDLLESGAKSLFDGFQAACLRTSQPGSFSEWGESSEVVATIREALKPSGDPAVPFYTLAATDGFAIGRFLPGTTRLTQSSSREFHTKVAGTDHVTIWTNSFPTGTLSLPAPFARQQIQEVAACAVNGQLACVVSDFPLAALTVDPSTNDRLLLKDGAGILSIEAGSVGSQTTFLQIPLSSPSKPTNSLKDAGVSFELQAADSATGAQVNQFSKPLTLTLNYQESALQGAGGTRPDQLGIFYFDATVGAYMPLPGRVVDGATRTVSGQTDHFTEFALLADVTPPVTTSTFSSPANAAGWHLAGTSVMLSAADANGLGIERITYAASGAQTVPTTSVTGSSATIALAAEGVATITYAARDVAGNEEAPKTFTVRIDKTAPEIMGARTPAANAAGWNNGPVTVTFTCSDATSGIETCGPVSQVVDTEGANHQRTGTATDKAGNTASATVSGINIDRTAPVSRATASPAANAAGWHRGPVQIALSASDALSGLASVRYSVDGGAEQVYSAPFTVSGDGEHVVKFRATDKADNVEAAQTLTVRIDGAAPQITGSRSPAANASGWSNAAVTVTFACSDPLSGIETCVPSSQVVDTDGANQQRSGTATDKAGNTASATVSGINIDRAAPVVTFAGNAGAYTVADTIAITCRASDALSGVASTTCKDVSAPAYTYALGQTTLRASATDKAGNEGSAATSVTVSVDHDSLCVLSRRFASKAGVGESLCAKLGAAKKDAGREQKPGTIATGDGRLRAYVHEVEAQRGKALTDEQAAVLLRLAASLP